MSTPTRLAPSRRTVLRTAAWTAPAISIAVAAPAFAMSGTSGNASGTASRNGKNVTVAATFTNTGVAHSGMYLTVSLPDNTFVSGGAASGWGHASPATATYTCNASLSGGSVVNFNATIEMQNNGQSQTVVLSFYDKDGKLSDTLTYGFTSKDQTVNGA